MNTVDTAKSPGFARDYAELTRERDVAEVAVLDARERVRGSGGEPPGP